MNTQYRKIRIGIDSYADPTVRALAEQSLRKALPDNVDIVNAKWLHYMGETVCDYVIMYNTKGTDNAKV
jgi:hypothetical protein